MLPASSRKARPVAAANPSDTVENDEGSMRRKQLLAAAIPATLSLGIHADKMTAMKWGCMGCHQPDRATMGPSIHGIAAKY